MAEIRIEKAVSVRAAVATFQVALMQLLEAAAGMTGDTDVTDLTVNVNLRVSRIDIARLSEDGQHLGQWLCGFSIDPRDIPSFGTPVGLPGMDGQTH
jgi:hypothetical protein